MLLGLVSVYMGVILMFGGFIMVAYGLMSGVVLDSLFIEWVVYTTTGGVNIELIFLLDYVSLVFIGVVMLVSSMVLVYSSDYMGGDVFFYRFISLVVLFVVSMILMVLSPNFISILLGWDGLGLVSYCLIIFYQNESSSSSGMLTVLSNRVGDVAILLAVSWMAGCGTWNFIPYFSLYGVESIFSFIILVLVVLAALTKSAQIPFSAWLPAAMAAPTPVSALVHSSTLVTAGVYLLIRFNELLGCSSVLFLISLSTTLMSGVGACLEQDGKKIIALSTLSQLGVMMFSLSLGLWEMAFFHLLSHAMFKSLLFMCIGLYIHGGQDQQDLRGIGFQLDSAPVVASYFIVSSLSLTGFPFLSGFYSKDSIVELFEYSHIGVLSYGLVLVSLLFTVFYSIRLITNLYLTETNTKLLVSTGGTGLSSMLSMLLLFILSVSGGSAMFSGFVPVVLMGFSHSVSVGLVIAVVGFLVGSTWLSLDSRVSAGQLGLVGISMVSMWFLLDFFTLMLTQGLSGGLNLLRGFDQGWLELLGAQGIFAKLKKPVSLLMLGIELGLSVYLSMGFVMVLILIMLNV